MSPEMVRIYQKYHREAKFQISWRLNIRNPIKITPVIHPGVGSYRDVIDVIEMLSFKFHGDWTSGTQSR